MSQARPAILNHELKTREQLQQRASRSKVTSNGTPVPSGEWVNLPGGEEFYVRSYGDAPYAVSGYRSAQPGETESPRLFKRRAVIDVLEEVKLLPMPKKHSGDLHYEGELVAVVAETGIGKSALSMQLANDVASGTSTSGLAVETDPQVVLYFDFENSDRQLLLRNSEKTVDGQCVNVYPYHKNLERLEMDATAHVFDRMADWGQFILREMDRQIVESGSKYLVIDNITYLSNETEKQKFALTLMQRLCEWKKERGLSIVVDCHTPKRDEARPLSLNDLAGSRILANFFDSIFAIGRSSIDPKLRYVKQLKVRSGELVYGAEHVAVFQFEKTTNRLEFNLIGHSQEKKHLQTPTDEAREKTIADVREMNAAGKSQREIAHALQISLGSVNTYLKRSRVTRNGEGRCEIEFVDPEREAAWNEWKQTHDVETGRRIR